MTPNEIVPLYLTILMAVLVAIAVIGGRNIAKKNKEGKDD